MIQKKTKSEVNQKLQEKFPFLEIVGDYIGANNKTLIRCNDCGYEWEAVPRSVISSKCGCKKCKTESNRIQNSLNKFLAQYNSEKYELVEFKDCMHVTVKCKKCGYLRTTNANNIYRYGCPKCGQESTHDKQKLSQSEFIKRSKLLHNNLYSYDKVNYINYSTPVIITCPIHGDFAQSPGKHLNGQGCPTCAGKEFSTQEFIRRAKLVHNNKYDYSETEYIDAHTPLKIICPKHGVYYQIPYVHFGMKCGCPTCSSSHGEEYVYNSLKSNNIKFIAQYKILNPYNIENTPREFKVDFYLPKYNAIIEYNGQQHYIPIDKFGGKLQFTKQITRDKYLRKYCQDNNINLLEIKYNCKDIDLEINKFISNCRIIE